MKQTQEFLVLQTTAIETQKKIKTWISTDYTIDIIAQSSVVTPKGEVIVITSLWRSKL